MNHHESRGKGYLANDFSLIFPLATNNKLDPWKTSAACLKQQRRQCRPGHHRFLREIGGFDRMIAEVCSASMTQSSPDLGKHGYLLARFKCKAGQFCRKGGLHSHKTLEKKNVRLSGLSLCNILHVICRQKHTETKSNH